MTDWLRQIFRAIGEGIADIRDKLLFEGFFGRRMPEQPSRSGWDTGPAEDDKPKQGAFDRFLGIDPDHAIDRARTDRDMDRAPGIDL
ncbi:hypothetical protein [Sphingobium sp. MK2]|uniref:hypothetical protein n=1 Tax=Sphingobium sp. MK2 TaxID=3116540 RepID=UPI0032E3684E